MPTYVLDIERLPNGALVRVMVERPLRKPEMVFATVLERGQPRAALVRYLAKSFVATSLQLADGYRIQRENDTVHADKVLDIVADAWQAAADYRSTLLAEIAAEENE